MRSNIACTCGSDSVPLPAPPADVGPMRATLLERAEVVDQLVELLRVALLEEGVGGHRRGGGQERAWDRLTRPPARAARPRPPPAGVAALARPVVGPAD